MGAIMLVGVYWFVDPQPAIKENKVETFFKEINEKQNIAPKRLYVNAWRKIKNEYYDVSMNSQDWYKWRYRYLNKIETLEDADVAINTMIASLNDRCSAFLRTEDYKKQKVIMEAQTRGIGAGLKKTADNKVFVNTIVTDSPAAESKALEIGDEVIEVNDVDVHNLSLTAISDLTGLQGKKSVKIKIKRKGKVIEKNIVIENIDIKNMIYFITEDNIAYIKIENFMGDKCIENFKKILYEIGDTNGIIIDLRNNYGGILTNAINIADLMLDENSMIVSLSSRGGYLFNIYAKPHKIFYEKPIVIITNNSTASSAEILAGALRDNLNAKIVGEQTYGKNTIQKIIPLQNMTGLVLTNGKYLLPNGEDIHENGIMPNIIVSNNNKLFDVQLDSAFDLMNVLIKTPWEVDEYLEKVKNDNISLISQKKSKQQNLYKVKHTKLI